MLNEVMYTIALRAIISTAIAATVFSIDIADDDFFHHGKLSQLTGLVEKHADMRKLYKDVRDMDHQKRLWRSTPFFPMIYFPSIPGFYRIPDFSKVVPFPNEPQLQSVKRTVIEDRILETGPSRRSKRLRICPFVGRAGLPLGGCLYSYVRPNHRSSARRRTRLLAPVKPVRRKIYRARWPEYYFLGGALGRR